MAAVMQMVGVEEEDAQEGKRLTINAILKRS